MLRPERGDEGQHERAPKSSALPRRSQRGARHLTVSVQDADNVFYPLPLDAGRSIAAICAHPYASLIRIEDEVGPPLAERRERRALKAGSVLSDIGQR